MGLFDIFTPKRATVEVQLSTKDPLTALLAEPEPELHAYDPVPKAEYTDWGAWGNGYSPIVTTIYNGEKNLGELGPVLKYEIDHNRLGRRAWQMFLGSETISTIIKQKGRWVLGVGLRLDAEPKIDVLNALGIKLPDDFAEEFNNTVESLWDVYASTPGMADYSSRVNLQKIAKRAERNAALWGDVLVVLRVSKDNLVKVQLIDGQHVSTPVGLSTIGGSGTMVDNYIGYDFVYSNGNRVRNGVEIDITGAHVAYHVRDGIGLEWKRIDARDKRGNIRAYLYTGEEYRLDDPRGMPKIAQSLESAKQLDDYTSAAVGSAVERQRIAYFIEHERGSDGSDPRATNLAAMVGAPGDSLDIPVDVNGKQLATTVAASTNRQTFNMPVGAKISSPETKQELYIKEFTETRSDAMAASADIPPEVVNQKYGGSYSASRAATNGFQFMLNIDRDDFGSGFKYPIYCLQLDLWVLTFKVQAPGYIEALRSGNQMILGAYRHSKWQGDPVPQIDELKEVQAARLKLGTAAAHIPLSTAEKVSQDLGEGNAKANLMQMKRELEETAEAGIEPLLKNPTPEKEVENPGEGKKSHKKKVL